MSNGFFVGNMYGPAVMELLEKDVNPFEMKSMVDHLQKELGVSKDDIFEMVGKKSVEIIRSRESEGKEIDIPAGDLIILATQTLCIDNAKENATTISTEDTEDDGDAFSPEQLKEGIKYLNDRGVDPNEFISMIKFLAKKDGGEFMETADMAIQTVQSMKPDVDIRKLQPEEYIAVVMEGCRTLCFAFAMQELGYIEVDMEEEDPGDETYQA